MGNPTVELVSAPASQRLLQDPHDKDIVSSVLKAQNGLIKVYHSVQHEDKMTGYLVVVWKSYEYHEKLINDPEAYAKAKAGIPSLFDLAKGPFTMVHVNPTSEPYNAFEAPVAEIATFRLHDGKSKPELEGLVDGLAKHLAEVVKTKRPDQAAVFHTSWGPLREKENVVVLFIGWTSVEAHWDLVKSDPGSSEFIEQLRAIAEVSVVHVPLI